MRGLQSAHLTNNLVTIPPGGGILGQVTTADLLGGVIIKRSTAMNGESEDDMPVGDRQGATTTTGVSKASPSFAGSTSPSPGHDDDEWLLSLDLQDFRPTTDTDENGAPIFLLCSSSATSDSGISINGEGAQEEPPAYELEEVVRTTVEECAPKTNAASAERENGGAGSDRPTLVLVTERNNVSLLGTAHANHPPPSPPFVEQNPVLTSDNVNLGRKCIKMAVPTALIPRRGGGARESAEATTNHPPSRFSPKPKKTKKGLKVKEVTLSEPAPSSSSTGGAVAPPPSPPTLPKHNFAESDDDGGGGIAPLRKCVVCLQMRPFTQDIYEEVSPSGGGGERPATMKRTNTTEPKLVRRMKTLLANIQIPIPTGGKLNEIGICPSCLDLLQRSYVFNCAVTQRHKDAAKMSGSFCDNSPLNLEPYQRAVYKNSWSISKAKEVYSKRLEQKHPQFAQRHLTDADWDVLCEHLHLTPMDIKSERGRELEKYINCSERLSHLYCIKCECLVENGKSGFLNHMSSHHPQDPVLLPCDICGGQFPDKTANKNSTSSTEDDDYYFSHWISHFYFFNACGTCGKRFPTKDVLTQHRRTMHNRKPIMPKGSRRPWKCYHCGAWFKLKESLDSHRDTVHFNVKVHLCHVCGEVFKSGLSLYSHLQSHKRGGDYKCTVCNKVFKTRYGVKQHATIHTGVKPYRCPICEREFRLKSSLSKHRQVHRKDDQDFRVARGHSGGGSSNAAITPTSSSSPGAVGIPSVSNSSSDPQVLTNNSLKEPPVKFARKEEKVDVYEQSTSSGVDPTNSFTSSSWSPTHVTPDRESVALEDPLGVGKHFLGYFVCSIPTIGPGD